MSIGKAIREIAGARGLSLARVAANSGTRNRSTIHELLNGTTTDPRVSTLLELCTVLRVTPGELLGSAGMVAPCERASTPADPELLQVFDALHGLADEDKQLCTAVIRGVVRLRAPEHGGARG